MAAAYLRFLSVFHNTGLQFVGGFFCGGLLWSKHFYLQRVIWGQAQVLNLSKTSGGSVCRHFIQLNYPREQFIFNRKVTLLLSPWFVWTWCEPEQMKCKYWTMKCFPRWLRRVKKRDRNLWRGKKCVEDTCKEIWTCPCYILCTFHFLSSSFKNQLHSAIVWLSVS